MKIWSEKNEKFLSVKNIQLIMEIAALFQFSKDCASVAWKLKFLVSTLSTLSKTPCFTVF